MRAITHSQFQVVLLRRLDLCKKVLASKASEYAGVGIDRMHNFNRAAEMLGGSREKALLGMLSKHLVSVFDMATEYRPLTNEQIDEKIGDAINYLILLEAMLKADFVE